MVELAHRFPSAGPWRGARSTRRRRADAGAVERRPFIMRTGTTVSYATRRFEEHIIGFTRLYEGLVRGEGPSRARRLEAPTRLSRPRLPSVRHLTAPGAAPPPAAAAEGPVRRLRVRAHAKTGGLATVGALPVPPPSRRRRAGRAAALRRMPWRDFEVLEGGLTVPMWFGPRAAACGSDGCGERRAGLLPRAPRVLRPPAPLGPPGGAYDDTSSASLSLPGALELTKALGLDSRRPARARLAAALVPVYVNTVEWAQPLHARRASTPSTTSPIGRVRRNALFVTGLGREHYHAGEFEHSAP